MSAVTLLTAGLISTIGTSAADAADAAATPGAVLQIASPWYQTRGDAEFADGDDIEVVTADTTHGVSARTTGSKRGSFRLTPPEGKPLTTGAYWLDPNRQHSEALPSLEIDGTDIYGDFTVLDLESDPTNGRITRFDAVVPGIGEFRFGSDPAGSVVLGARNVVFEKRFIGLPKKSQVQTVHNTGTAPVSLGKPVVTGVDAKSFSVSNSTCAATLAADATCTFSINFRPRVAGPATAAVSLPVGATTQTVALTGSAFLGKTMITSSGKDMVNKGKTTKATSGSTQMLISYAALDWWFRADDLDGSGGIVSVRLGGPYGKAFPLGTTKTSPSGKYSIVTTVDSYGCDTTGTMTVKQFALDPVTGLPATVDMSFTQYCADKIAQHGTLQWQARSDVTAPAAPTGVRVASATPTKVKWTSSASKDATSVVARLVQGDGAGATAQSGVPLVVTGASAAVPKLPTGQQYTIAVFAVDGTGNVSKAASTSFGTAPVTVTAPGRPTVTGTTTGPGSVTVTFDAPASDGGLPITSYVLSGFHSEQTVSGTSSPLTLTGLPAGNNQVTVVAVNAAGKGMPSAARVVTVE
ncbi:choice-of-anchor D domain-containing protein [Curtobacterium sp. MCLR17_036]|uniref:choice-of-anchor D domain-containing protein n=1 Tax=Curtobacterium sp. MCLR17_036 TaxID=2175620 RepID=UPI0015E8E59B|nr:choice-of-anchor D domain-containing protein [Curtobacterium sp. MCLR17_036]WIE64887.1 choice-of-anchor D domain-containing protein [Curtobacterium sp. MCLR17_036]